MTRQASEWVRAGIQGYVASRNLPPVIEGHWAPNDEGAAREIARLYTSMPVVAADSATLAAYAALAVESAEQYNWATQRIGVTFVHTAEDPYRDSAEMLADVHERHTLRVYQGWRPASHPRRHLARRLDVQ